MSNSLDFPPLNMLIFIYRTVQTVGRDWKGLYKCFCGKEFETRISYVRNGHTKSCGCLRICPSRKTHGHSLIRSNSYTSWQSMKSRCLNENNKDWKTYGGRGITVDPLWELSFEAFLKDMGERPGIEYSIDRIDPDGNYTKENCRWLLKSENGRRARPRDSTT